MILNLILPEFEITMKLKENPPSLHDTMYDIPLPPPLKIRVPLGVALTVITILETPNSPPTIHSTTTSVNSNELISTRSVIEYATRLYKGKINALSPPKRLFI